MTKNQSGSHPLVWHYLRTLFVSLVMVSLCGLYIYAQNGKYDLRQLNRAFADAGMILIGLSLVLSSVAYFWDFADAYISYRKDLGLIGFGYVVAHALISLFGMPAVFPFPDYYLAARNVIPFVCAILAFVIYVVMAVISNQYAVRLLGGQHWKYLLRVGFVAYVLSILHYGLKAYPYWGLWVTQSTSVLPPLSIWVTIFGVAVLVYRICLWFALLRP